MSTEVDLEDLVNSIDGFSDWKDADKIRLFSWFQSSKAGKQYFRTSDINACYDALGLDKPSVSGFLSAMEKRKPKQLLKNNNGYKLERRVYEVYEKKYGTRPATILVDRLLSDLPTKVQNVAEREFLEETITCYRSKAFRAALVMAWNLAYDHICFFILKKHRKSFNAQWPIRFPKMHAGSKIRSVSTREHFEELKESEVIEIARSAAIITAGTEKLLKEKLGKRNSYAHPSSLTIAPQTAEEAIIDLVNNVVLKLKY